MPYKSQSLKSGLIYLSIIIIMKTGIVTAMADSSISWQCSTEAAPWTDKGQIATTAWDNDQSSYVQIDSTKKLQTISGWGGCFNERGWDAMLVLSDDNRQSVLKALFDPEQGLKLNICRTPIGASDYAISLYSLDDITEKDDYEMKNFSINRDKERLLPYIKAAMAIKPDLKLWAVPWSPPPWMKTGNALEGGALTNLFMGGTIKTDPKTLDALALYFEKYVQAYKAEGINIFMVMPQNEPQVTAPYATCTWGGNELRDFIKDHLGPKFAADSIDCEIWLGALMDSDGSKYGPTLNDDKAMSYVKGFGFQYFGNKACIDIRKKYPDTQIMQTETICGGGNSTLADNSWPYAEGQFDNIKLYMEAGVNSYMLWNMVLDETGRNTALWSQNAPITVNKTTRKITYNPQYYFYKHFSYYVQPGASMLAVEGNYDEKVAYVNPEGETVLEIQNKTDHDAVVAINFNGQKIKPTLSAHSMNTFRMAKSE